MYLDSIPDESSHNSSGPSDLLTFDDLSRLYQLINSNGKTPAHQAICSVILRLIEMGLLQDPMIQKIGRLWSTLGEDAQKKLNDRVFQLTKIENIPSELTDYLSNILSGSAFQRGRRKVEYNEYFGNLVRNNIKVRRNKALRCEACGYHFRIIDLGYERREVAQELGANFSNAYHTFRNNNADSLKPIFIDRDDSKKLYLTQLTLDHKLPEEGLGWSGEDNLQITCKLCNQGKMAYRRPLEGLSLFAAGGLADFPRDRGWNGFKASVVSFTFEYYNRKCCSCQQSSKNVELTVRYKAVLHDPNSDNHRAFAPWNLEAICYGCLETKRRIRP